MNVNETSSLQFYFNNNLEAKAVILEILTVLCGIVVQFSVGYECRVAPYTWRSFLFCHSSYQLSVGSVNRIVLVV